MIRLNMIAELSSVSSVSCGSFVSLIALVSVVCTLPSQAQSVGPRTVGDGTAFVFTPGKSEGYGIYSGDIGGTGSTGVGAPLYSYHRRLGESTGIGSSTMQTTSATSESRPAAVSGFAPAGSDFTLARPNLPSSTFGGAYNPALSGYTVGPSNGILSGSGLTAGYAESRSIFSGQVSRPTSLFQDLDAVPSFARKGAKTALPLTGASNDELFKKVEPQF